MLRERLKLTYRLLPNSAYTVLDLGGEISDLGFLAFHLKESGRSVYFLNIDEDSVNIALKKMGEGIEYLVGDALFLPFKKKTFDAVIMTDVLEHLNNSEKALTEINRILKEKSVLILSCPHKGLFDFFDPMNFKQNFNFLYKNVIKFLNTSKRNKIRIISNKDFQYHKHFLLKELKVLFDRTGFEIKQYFRKGGFFYGLFDFLRNTFQKIDAPLFLIKCCRKIMEIDYVISHGPFSYNIILKLIKKETILKPKRINIMHMVSGLGVGDGIQHVLDSIVSCYDKNKYNLTICCLSKDNELLQEYQKKEVKVFEINAKSSMSIRYFLINLIATFKLCKILKKENVKIVTTHEFFSGTIGRIAAILARVSVVLWMVHNQDSWKKQIHIVIDRILVKFTDKIIVNSIDVKKFNSQLENIDINKHIVIHNGINLNKFSPISKNNGFRKKLGINQDAPIITNISRLVLQKGQKYILEAGKIVIEKYPKIKFLLVGDNGDFRDGSTKEELLSLTKSLGLSNNVIFVGKRTDIPQILANTDIFVYSSLWEGFGLAIVEAMAMAKPVIATKVGAVPEVVEHNKTGILVSPSNPQELGNAILELLKDKKKASYMGVMGRRRVEDKFSSQIMTKNLENLYETLLKEKDIYV